MNLLQPDTFSKPEGNDNESPKKIICPLSFINPGENNLDNNIRLNDTTPEQNEETQRKQAVMNETSVNASYNQGCQSADKNNSQEYINGQQQINGFDSSGYGFQGNPYSLQAAQPQMMYNPIMQIPWGYCYPQIAQSAMAFVNNLSPEQSSIIGEHVATKVVNTQIDLFMEKEKSSMRIAENKEKLNEKNRADVEAEDAKDNVKHSIKEVDGQLYYVSSMTSRRYKISEGRNFKIERLEVKYPQEDPILHISCENNGIHDCFIRNNDFHMKEDDELVSILGAAGIPIEFSRRNKTELLNLFKLYVSAEAEKTVREIPHHTYWNIMGDGSYKYVMPGEESLETVLTSRAENKHMLDTWACINTDPYNHRKILFMMALNRLSFIITELFESVGKPILMLVTENQMKYAKNLFEGASLIADTDDYNKVGKAMTSTYTGFVMYLYKRNNAKSGKIIQMLHDVYEDRRWDDKRVTSIPLVISEEPLPNDLMQGFFTVVVNDDLMQLRFEDAVLNNQEMMQLVDDFHDIIIQKRLDTDYIHLFFAGIYLARAIKSDRCTEENAISLVSEMICSDALDEGITSSLEEFKEAVYEYITKDIAVYDVRDVSVEFDADKDLLFDQSYIYVSRVCFKKIVSDITVNTGMNAIKKQLVDEGCLVPYGSACYTAKCTYCCNDKDETKVMLRLDRKVVSDPPNRMDIIRYKNIFNNREGDKR